MRCKYRLPIIITQHQITKPLKRKFFRLFQINNRKKKKTNTGIRFPSSLSTFHPFANSTLGWTTLFHDNLPHLLCASSRPLNSPGTPMDSPPSLADPGSCLNIVSFANPGATSRKSIVYTSDRSDGDEPGIRTTMYPPPPIPELN